MKKNMDNFMTSNRMNTLRFLFFTVSTCRFWSRVAEKIIAENLAVSNIFLTHTHTHTHTQPPYYPARPRISDEKNAKIVFFPDRQKENHFFIINPEAKHPSLRGFFVLAIY